MKRGRSEGGRVVCMRRAIPSLLLWIYHDLLSENVFDATITPPSVLIECLYEKGKPRRVLISLQAFVAGIVHIAEHEKNCVLLGRDTKKEVDFRPCLYKHWHRDGFNSNCDISATLEWSCECNSEQWGNLHRPWRSNFVYYPHHHHYAWELLGDVYVP